MHVAASLQRLSHVDQTRIGLDTDSDGLVDLVEIAQWSLPMEDAWAAWLGSVDSVPGEAE